MNATQITKGATVKFRSQLEAANGTWRVYNIQGDDVRLGRVGVRGQMLKPNADNLLTLPMNAIESALAVGTAKIL